MAIYSDDVVTHELLFEVKEKQKEIFINALDTKCLNEYGMTSGEIEKEYYDKSSKLTDLMISINSLVANSYHCKQEKKKKVNFFKKILISYFPEHKVKQEQYFKYLDKSILANETKRLVLVEQFYKILPDYQIWRKKISRMNIPTFARYRAFQGDFFNGIDLNETAVKILDGKSHMPNNYIDCRILYGH
jgi:hypothetical protein